MKRIYVILSLITFIAILQACMPTKPVAQTPKVVNTVVSEIVKKDTVIVPKEPVALAFGSNEVLTKDFQKQFEARKEIDSLTSNQVVEQIVLENQLVLEAKNLGYDKDEDYKNELLSHRDVLSQTYFLDTALVTSLTKEAYRWLQNEVKIAHIMLPVSDWASVSDTAKVYNVAYELRNRALAGEDFGMLAAKYSVDEKTKNKNGELDWFTALQLHYPLEKAAFTLPVGGISTPIRAKGAYHIIKVLDKRPNSGKVQVAHILKLTPPSFSENQKNAAKKLIDSLYVLLQSGGNFEMLCNKYSDDINNKDDGGVLPEFGIGSKFEQSFENVAFGLKEGEISQPFQSSVGWHIMKLIKKKPLESYAELKKKLYDKVMTDSRGEYLKQQALNKIKSKLNFTENGGLVEAALAKVDSSVYVGRWNYILNDEINDKVLFSLANKKSTAREFFEHVYDAQKSARKEKLPLRDWAMKSYSSFQDSTIRAYVFDNIEKIDTDFGSTLSQIGNEMLVSRLMNYRVYEASLDTVAQRGFFEKNRAKYVLQERANALIFKAKEEKNIKALDEILAKGTPYQLKRGILPINFAKFAKELTIEDKKRLLGLIAILAKNPDYIVEIGGHSDINENENVSAERMKEVVNFLTSNGLPLNRLIEFDYKNTKPADKFDWTKNQRVSFQFFSNSPKDIAKIFNSKEANALEVEEGNFEKGKNPVLSGVNWLQGSYNVKRNDYFYKIIINKIESPRLKTIKEARGEVIRDYQAYLLEDLKRQMNNKYPVKLNNTEIEKVKNEIKN